ncbi:hypothetical protein F5148DRAFT_1150902 [Russula earlei]|uniref:Uncharacterized protein n=1 Tax=Russula earlei TaxID=71964 RepID=A0ACC0U3T1_9AGAM|nr:hypothetical protein F5148DRAFT_1150902 [Russula earlei]
MRSWTQAQRGVLKPVREGDTKACLSFQRVILSSHRRRGMAGAEVLSHVEHGHGVVKQGACISHIGAVAAAVNTEVMAAARARAVVVAAHVDAMEGEAWCGVVLALAASPMATAGCASDMVHMTEEAEAEVAEDETEWRWEKRVGDVETGEESMGADNAETVAGQTETVVWDGAEIGGTCMATTETAGNETTEVMMGDFKEVVAAGDTTEGAGVASHHGYVEFLRLDLMILGENDSHSLCLDTTGSQLCAPQASYKLDEPLSRYSINTQVY